MLMPQPGMLYRLKCVLLLATPRQKRQLGVRVGLTRAGEGGISHSDNSAKDKERRVLTVERELLDAIKATGPSLYVNIANRPMVEIPFESPPEVRKAWPLDSDSVEAEVALFAYSRPIPIVLRDRQVTQIIRVMKGLAWRTHRAPENLSDAFDDDPLLEALDAIVNTDSPKPLECTMSELLNKLRDAAGRLGINQDEKAWPKGPAQFSKHLTELSDQGSLEKVGIEFSRNKNARPRSILLRPALTSDATSLAVSEQRRDPNTALHQELQKVDGNDGAAAIFHFLNAPPPQRSDTSLP